MASAPSVAPTTATSPASRPVGGPAPQQTPAPAAPPVDPTRVPCPVDRWSTDRTQFTTSTKEQTPPPSDSPYISIDTGNAGPRYVRSSLYAVPRTPELWKKSTLPFALVVNPLAAPAPGEAEVPVVDLRNKEGPLRCSRCMAYVCAAFAWQGRSFTCTICGHVNSTNEAQPDYAQGSVDLLVGPSFRAEARKVAKPLGHVFCVDVSFGAQKSGVMQLMLASLRSVVEHLPEEMLHVALVTYSDVVHCYDCTGTRPKMLVVHAGAAPEDVVCPSTNLVGGSRERLLETIDAIPGLHSGAAVRQECDVLKAIRVAGSILQERGGRLCVCVASNPSSLEDRLRAAAPLNILGTDDERPLYDLDTKNTAWKDLSAWLIGEAVSVDFFVLAPSFVDLGTLSWCANRSGGRVYYYPSGGQGDELKLQEELRSRMVRRQAFDGVMRVRTSKGVTVSAYRGAFANDRVTDELEMAALDETSTLCLDLAIDGDVGNVCVVQIALLYTMRNGQRAVRLHTLSLPVAQELPHVFRMADLDATLFWTASMGAQWAVANGVKHARGEVARRVGEMLAAYRQHCARNPAPGQLILPEALKLLPAYVLGFLKSQMLRPSTTIGPHHRCHYLRNLVPFSAGPAHIMAFCYPYAVPLHDVEDDSSVYGFPNEWGGVNHPAPVRLLKAMAGPGVVMLFDDGLSLRVFFHCDAGRVAELLSEPWAAEGIDIRPLPWDAVAEARTSPWAQRVSNIVQARRLECGVWKNVYVCRAGDGDESVIVNSLLVEDSVSSSMSLTGFLKHLHSKISSAP